MPKSRAPYPPEFRAEAIRLARTSGRPPAGGRPRVGHDGRDDAPMVEAGRPEWTRPHDC